jgi:hypothetical protein
MANFIAHIINMINKGFQSSISYQLSCATNKKSLETSYSPRRISSSLKFRSPFALFSSGDWGAIHFCLNVTMFQYKYYINVTTFQQQTIQHPSLDQELRENCACANPIYNVNSTPDTKSFFFKTFRVTYYIYIYRNTILYSEFHFVFGSNSFAFWTRFYWWNLVEKAKELEPETKRIHYKYSLYTYVIRNAFRVQIRIRYIVLQLSLSIFR